MVSYLYRPKANKPLKIIEIVIAGFGLIIKLQQKLNKLRDALDFYQQTKCYKNWIISVVSRPAGIKIYIQTFSQESLILLQGASKRICQLIFYLCF